MVTVPTPERTRISALAVPNAPTPIIKTCLCCKRDCPSKPIPLNNVWREYLFLLSSCSYEGSKFVISYRIPHLYLNDLGDTQLDYNLSHMAYMLVFLFTNILSQIVM